MKWSFSFNVTKNIDGIQPLFEFFQSDIVWLLSIVSIQEAFGFVYVYFRINVYRNKLDFEMELRIWLGQPIPGFFYSVKVNCTYPNIEAKIILIGETRYLTLF